jgi:hypothetical protein
MRTVTRGKSTYQQNTANIGRKPVEIREPEPEALSRGTEAVDHRRCTSSPRISTGDT